MTGKIQALAASIDNLAAHNPISDGDADAGDAAGDKQIEASDTQHFRSGGNKKQAALRVDVAAEVQETPVAPSTISDAL
jgi:hypothetical protein